MKKQPKERRPVGRPKKIRFESPDEWERKASKKSKPMPIKIIIKIYL